MLKTTIKINLRCPKHPRYDGEESWKRRASCYDCSGLADIAEAIHIFNHAVSAAMEGSSLVSKAPKGKGG